MYYCRLRRRPIQCKFSKDRRMPPIHDSKTDDTEDLYMAFFGQENKAKVEELKTLNTSCEYW
ncbi:hypothetical protein CASFOL_034430 [Castilleja foliolosa]|uniref:Uncharacterized protein n=1 Tax=Castilleja foliolosa TaxID=1961234 RepID=A0ABD3BW71_9LAMI